MNFALGVIIIVGVLVAIILGFIAIAPDDIPEPRIVEIDTSKVIDIDESKTMDDLDDPISCIAQWDPVCGMDGETYGNSCELDVANIELDYEGECTVEEKLVVCTMEYDPKCGVDGETYGNLCMLDAADIKLDYQGECVVEATTVEAATVEAESEATPESEATLEPLTMTGIVTIPPGAAVPGCDNANECYLPYTVSVATGATVLWSNNDSAPHTVSSGTVDGGLTEIFDSGLFMAGDSFEFTFDTAGTYDYFCMVHPWMTGIVSVS